MVDEFVINSWDGKRAVFDSPKFVKQGWLGSYRLTLESPLVQVSIEVENPPYGLLLTEYFRNLADNWKGWAGVKCWESIEGEFSLAAIMSKTGHATLKITMNIYGSPNEWVVIAELEVEAGQLERIAKDAERFFNA